jgi:hypothetical protein
MCEKSIKFVQTDLYTICSFVQVGNLLHADPNNSCIAGIQEAGLDFSQ